MCSLSRDHGIPTVCIRAPQPLRIRVNISATGSLCIASLLTVVHLPARLHDTRNLAVQGAGAEADAAHAELPEERTRPPAQRATVVSAHLELRLAGCLNHFRRFCHSR